MTFFIILSILSIKLSYYFEIDLRKTDMRPFILSVLAPCFFLIACSQNAQEPTPALAAVSAEQSVKQAEGAAALAGQTENAVMDNFVSEPADEEDDEWDDEEDEFDDFEEEFAQSPGEEILDPFEGYNRFMTAVNDGLIVYVLDPVARGYRYVAPEGARRGVNRFFHNLLYPVRLVGNVLQAKFKRSGVETARFAINTTIGILGLFDPAKEWFGLEPYEEDFGQALGFWGVGAGPHIVLPILGPSNMRDTFSLYPDWQIDPVAEVEPLEAEIGVRAFQAVNKYSLRIEEYESVKKDAVDLYLFLRDGYEQIRKKEIEE